MAFRGKTIIVEDDPGIRESLAEICRMFLDIEPLEAATAEEALLLFQEQRPAVALLDLYLADKGGEWIVEEVRRRGWGDEVRMVIMSAHSDAAETAARLHVYDVLHKPFSLKDVTELLEKAGAS